MSDSTSGPRDEEPQDGEARASPEVEVEAFGKQRATPERGRIYHVLLASLLLLMALQPYADVAGGVLVRLAFGGLLLASVAVRIP